MWNLAAKPQTNKKWFRCNCTKQSCGESEYGLLKEFCDNFVHDTYTYQGAGKRPQPISLSVYYIKVSSFKGSNK